MANAKGRTMSEIGYGMGKNYRSGKYKKDCPNCSLMLADFDRKGVVLTSLKCPRCGGVTT